MINFHKYGFLDVRKLQSFVHGKNLWHHRYNPVWLFIWSDLYKPEIAFTNEYIFIRYYMPDLGMCYYHPFSEKADMLKGIEMLKEDAKENGFDFYIAPIGEAYQFKFDDMRIKYFINEQFNSYIYNAMDIALLSNIKYKKKRNLYETFERNNKTAYFKNVVKEDFPMILEFINDYNALNQENGLDQTFYSKLNMINKTMEHLYELDIYAIELVSDEKVIGLAFGSMMDNEICLHLCIARNDYKGAIDFLFSSFAKTVQAAVKYINFEEDSGIKDIKKIKEGYNPSRIEKFFGTFNI